MAPWLNELENEHIVLTHLSQRTHIGEAKRILREKLKPEMAEKVTILMDRSCFQGRKQENRIEKAE